MLNSKWKKLYAIIFIAVLICFIGVAGIQRYYFPFSRGFFPGSIFNSKVSVEWVIEPKFYAANQFCYGVAWVQEEKDGPWKLIDAKGETLVVGQAKNVYAYDENTRLAPFSTNGFWGYVNLSGDIVISPQYLSAGYFDYGMAVVSKKIGSNVLEGVIDHCGKVVLPLSYENVRIIDSNLFSVKKDKKWGGVNRNGEVVIDYISEEYLQLVCQPNVLAITIGEKVGLIDNKGQWILPVSYDYVYIGGGGLIALEKGKKIGFVDTKGNTVIDFQFPRATRRNWSSAYSTYGFSENLAVVLLSETPLILVQESQFAPQHYAPQFEKTRCGVIDKSGKTLFTFQGYPRSRFIDGLMLVEGPNGLFFMDQSGDQYPLPSGIRPQVYDWSGKSFSKGILRTRYEDGKFGYLRISIR